jgi:hypothetical protein
MSLGGLRIVKKPDKNPDLKEAPRNSALRDCAHTGAEFRGVISKLYFVVVDTGLAQVPWMEIPAAEAPPAVACSFSSSASMAFFSDALTFCVPVVLVTNDCDICVAPYL